MRALLVALIVLLPLALAPAHATSSVHERNVAYLWALVGEHDPATLALTGVGRAIPLAQGIAELAAGAGSVDLAAMASGAVQNGEKVYAGDTWIVVVGFGACPSSSADIFVPTPIPFTMITPQMWLYDGGAGTVSGDAVSAAVFGWTAKTTTTYNNIHWDAAGAIREDCVTFGGIHLAFLRVTGATVLSGS